MNSTLFVSIAALLLSGSPPPAEECRPTAVGIHADTDRQLTLLRADLQLPAGRWQVVRTEGSLMHPVVWHPGGGLSGLPGERSRRLLVRRQERKAAQALYTMRWRIRQLEHRETWPANTSEEEARRQLETMYTNSPWPEDPRAVEGPFFFRIPGVSVPKRWTREREPLVLELRPYFEDGRHHVLYTNGTVARVEPDAELLKRHDLKITPVVSAEEMKRSGDDRQLLHLLALIPSGVEVRSLRAKVLLRRVGTSDETTVLIAGRGAEKGDPEILKRWASGRSVEWRLLAEEAPASALSTWLSRHEAVYGAAENVPGRAGARNRGRTTSVFNVLGGRAAIRETLQMQALPVSQDADPSADRTIDVKSIPGVQVKSHPYEEMLGEQAGGTLSIANHVPSDRFLVYFSKPVALAGFLDKGVEFLFQTSQVFTGSSLKYKLVDRYLQRFGMNTEWVKGLLRSGAVKEIALVLPDLFLLDGTEITAILRIPNLDLMVPLLSLIGVKGLDSASVVERLLPDGQKAYWAVRNDLLLVSSHRSELEAVLALGKQGGRGSLGQSAEFRYMLTKLPVRDTTRGFAYLSDSFIRRLVGPEVKIGQFRRLQARADLETLSSGALLYRADGRGEPPHIDDLVTRGYIPKRLSERDYRLDEDLVARSALYGTPSDLRSLLDVPVEKVTPSEQAAYKQYVEGYSRFWRQFFDPIAVRFDGLDSGEYELEVFILPLLDSSLYNAVRNFLVTHESGVPLRVPRFEPEPVLMFSANLPDSAWVELIDEFDFFYRQFGLPLEAIDELGPSVHVAILDGDPVLNLGSGDILGGFGMSTQRGMMRDSEMLAVPALLSILTRPCKVLVELRDSKRVLGALRAAWIHQKPNNRWDFGYDMTQLEDRDAWIFTVDILGFARLRLGIEVRGGYLIVSNIPWTEHSRFRGVRGGHLDSALLQVAPGVGQLQLPGLFTAASEKSREAALESAGYLLPLLLGGAESVEAAQEWHRRLFGFTPVHPDQGTYRWKNSRLESDRFGSIVSQKQPAYEAGDREFGWLRKIHDLDLSLQLEEGGLRTRVRWKLR